MRTWIHNARRPLTIFSPICKIILMYLECVCVTPLILIAVGESSHWRESMGETAKKERAAVDISVLPARIWQDLGGMEALRLCEVLHFLAPSSNSISLTWNKSHWSEIYFLMNLHRVMLQNGKVQLLDIKEYFSASICCVSLFQKDNRVHNCVPAILISFVIFTTWISLLTV